MGNLVSIGVDKGSLRLVVRKSDRRKFIYLGLKNTPKNREKATEVKELVEKDLKDGCFDESLNKYIVIKSSGKRVDSLTVPELFDIWLKDHAKDVSARTIEWYKLVQRDLDQVFTKAIGVHLTGTHATKYRRWLEAKGNSAYVIKRKLGAVKKAWTWLIENNYVSFNPWVNSPKQVKVPPQELPKPFSFTEIEKLIETFDASDTYRQLKPFVEFLFFTGTRLGEAAGLRWQDLNDDLTEVTISSQLTVGIRKPCKANSIRSFKLSPRVTNLLSSLKTSSVKEKGLVFKWNNRAINLPRFRARPWTKMLKQAGIKYRKPYNTRATFVSLALKEGLPPSEVGRITGHSVATMFKHYAGYIEDVPTLPF